MEREPQGARDSCIGIRPPRSHAVSEGGWPLFKAGEAGCGQMRPDVLSYGLAEIEVELHGRAIEGCNERDGHGWLVVLQCQMP